ncbi:MAG: hypothetical protein KGV51_05880 [Moraxellaceae bacterium]|nr:hypothetical protein [Moraxellaceae bacterium]
MKQEINKVIDGALNSLDAGQRTHTPKNNLKINSNNGANIMIAQDDDIQKNEKLLMLLIKRGKRGLTTFDTRDDYGDTALRSDISKLHKHNGFELPREWVKEGVYKTRCKRYWLSDDDIPKAKKMINHLRIKRGKKPLFEV